MSFEKEWISEIFLKKIVLQLLERIPSNESNVTISKFFFTLKFQFKNHENLAGGSNITCLVVSKSGIHLNLDPRIVGDLDDQRIESRDDARANGWARSSVYLLRTRIRNGSLNKPGSTTVSGVTILLSLTVFLNLVAETLPQVSDAIPLLGTLSFYKQTCASVNFLLLRMDVPFFSSSLILLIMCLVCNEIFIEHFLCAKLVQNETICKKEIKN